MSERLIFTAPLTVYGVRVAEIDAVAWVSMDQYGDPEIDRIEVDGTKDGRATESTLPSDHPLYPIIKDWLRRDYAKPRHDACHGRYECPRLGRPETYARGGVIHAERS